MEVLEDYIVSDGKLKGLSASESKSLLFLNPNIMELEIEKIKDMCPIYKQVTSEGVKNIFYNQLKRITDDNLSILYNLPKSVIIPIGGILSPYLLTKGDNGFGIVNRETRIMMLSNIHELKYLEHYALLSKGNHSYLIDNNGITLLNGEIVKIDIPNNCICTKDIKSNTFYLCTQTGNFIAKSDNFWELFRLAKKETTVSKESISLPKNTYLFEQMIIKKLKSIQESKDRCGKNLIEISFYLANIGKDIVIDLTNLNVYETIFTKALKICEDDKKIWVKDEGIYTTNQLDILVRKRRREEDA